MCSCCPLLLQLMTLSFLYLTLSGPQTVEACKPGYIWESQTFHQRAAQADIIAYGKVINLTPIAEWPNAWPDAYDAEFEFYCVLRASITLSCADIDPDQFGICIDDCGDYVNNASCPDNEMCCSNGCGHVCVQPVEKSGIDRISVVRNMGDLTSCSRTLVENGTNYIMLLQWRNGELEPHEINIQSAAFLETDEIWNDLSFLCDVEPVGPLGTNGCGNVTMYKLQIVPDQPCYSAVPSHTTNMIILLLIIFGHVMLII